MTKQIKKSTQGKKQTLKFTIDCRLPIEDNVIVLKDFESFLTQKIKVDDKTGNLGTSVTVSADKDSIVVEAKISFSKRYLKYLTKKYLKQQDLRDYLHVIATNASTYELKYFNISDAGGVDAEDEDE